MFFLKKIHLNILTFLILTSLIHCQLKEPVKNHGIIYLKNRSDLIVVNKSNKNDTINIIGQPHSMSTFDENEWIYFERVITKGEFLKLGKNVLKTNNLLILKFDKYGIIEKKNFLDKNDINKISFSENTTDNDLTQKSFVQKFLSSLRNKMYGKK